MFTFGVDSFIWSENFSDKDLWIITKARELGFQTIDLAVAHPSAFPTQAVRSAATEAGIDVVITTTLGKDTNLISPDQATRRRGIDHLMLLVDIAQELGARVIGGVNYAGWGCLSGKPRTHEEWGWSVTSMRTVAEYAQKAGDLYIAVEPVNRFETHFLNIAEDAVAYCRDVGIPNMRVHLDSFHMIREETSFAGAVGTCGREFLGYVHVCENNRGIPGTGLVPWKEFFTALKGIGYFGPLTIESFDPSFEELNRLCAIWRTFANSGEELAIQGLKRLQAIAATV